jgi:hypothetical protein
MKNRRPKSEARQLYRIRIREIGEQVDELYLFVKNHPEFQLYTQEKASAIDNNDRLMRALLGICTRPGIYEPTTRQQAAKLLRLCSESEVPRLLAGTVRKPPDNNAQMKTAAAMSLVWLDTDESVSTLTSLVDDLTDQDVEACIRELRRDRENTREDALAALSQRRTQGLSNRRQELSNRRQAFTPVTSKRGRPIGGMNKAANPKQLDWPILPIGWWTIPKYKLLATRGTQDRQSGQLVIDRLIFLDSLNPKERYIGQDRFGSDPYWVFVFEEHVVAECPMEGNAIYVVHGTHDWKTLLNRSKRALRAAAANRYKRIVHRGDWKTRITTALGHKVLHVSSGE